MLPAPFSAIFTSRSETAVIATTGTSLSVLSDPNSLARNLINRRTVLKTSALAAVGAAVGGCCESHKTCTSGKLGFNNADFYDA
ncbi:MAG: twin-arginine translocation signal domain-containing protein, partial [Planctomycetota bacterium]